jgi:hypothetical protein
MRASTIPGQSWSSILSKYLDAQETVTGYPDAD